MMQNSLASQKGLGKIDVSLSQLKLSNLLAGIIIFFSATQLGFHFWPLSSLVYGIRIDYLSPTLYFLDILIILYLGSDLLQRVVPSRSEGATLPGLPALVPILLINLLFSQNPLATLSWSLHFILYFVFLRRLLNRRPEQGSSRDAEGGRCLLVGTLRLALTLSLLFQTLLATIQVFLGHSVGGLMYYLGERSVAVGSPGIALATFLDHVVLRAYGTFSHSNILAGWSVVVLLIIIQLHKQRAVRRSDLFGISFPLLLASFLIFLAQSRSAAISLFGIIIPFYLIKNLRHRISYFVVMGLIVFRFGILSPTRSDLSSAQRLDLQGVSLKVISQYPIFGTGVQASISTYSSLAPNFRLLQPDHNSLTLFLSWFGLFGVTAALLPLKSRIWRLPSILLPISPLLLLDHYLLTSSQGLFILLLYLSVALNYSHAQKNI